MHEPVLLSIDVQPEGSHARLFEMANGQYSLLAELNQKHRETGQDGVLAALDKQVFALLRRLEQKSGWKILGEGKELLRHTQEINSGVGKASLSLQPARPLRTALLALSPSYSLDSLRRVAGFLNTEIVLERSAQDDLNASAQLMELLQTDADLFLVAGGTNNGASKPLRTAIENLRILFHHQPRVVKPQIVFLGNEQLGQFAKKEIEAGPNFHLGPNIQPEIDQEDLLAGWRALADAFRAWALQTTPGLKTQEELLQEQVQPGFLPALRVLRLLAAINSNGKGVLCLDLGEGQVSVGAATVEGLVARQIPSLPQPDFAGEVMARAAGLYSLEEARTYLLERQAHPGFKPASESEMALEIAWQSARLAQALEETAQAFPQFGFNPNEGLTTAYEPIILSGESLKRFPNQAQTLLWALDTLRPWGITTLVLDPDGILNALGALAATEPLLAAQMLDAGIFENLGTVVNVTGGGMSRSLLKLEIDQGEGQSREPLDVKAGELRRIPVAADAPGRLYLAPQNQADVGMGQPGLGGWLRVSGGNLGVVIDARGRPLKLSGSGQERAEQRAQWLQALGVP